MQRVPASVCSKPYREEVEWLDPEGGSSFAFLTCSRK